MKLWKRVGRQRWAQVTIGIAAAEYLRLVALTNRTVVEPQPVYDNLTRDMPIIIAMWHGQHILAPFIRRPHHNPTKVLISRHRDGEINARAAERLGIGTVRGSGNHDRRFDEKGGVGAFWAMLASLQEGNNMALTADVPKVAKVAGLGLEGRDLAQAYVTALRWARELNASA